MTQPRQQAGGKEIARIGREANAAERGLQLVLERAEVREEVARNLFGTDHGLHGARLATAWRALAGDARDAYMRQVIDRVREHAKEYVPSAAPDENDPFPGATQPSEIRIA